MKIYTRTGDEGMTSLFSGERVAKTSLRVEAYGTLDELNSHLGLARSFHPRPEVDATLEKVQNQLFRAGADLATLPGTRETPRIGVAESTWLEGEIDQMTERLPALRAFILPGGTPAAAHIQVARAVCRRAERLAILLAQNEAVSGELLIYLNRLSDFLFVLARFENFLAGRGEEKWTVSE